MNIGLGYPRALINWYSLYKYKVISIYQNNRVGARKKTDQAPSVFSGTTLIGPASACFLDWTLDTGGMLGSIFKYIVIITRE